jgi:polysaccharide biosynthesis transport protein
MDDSLIYQDKQMQNIFRDIIYIIFERLRTVLTISIVLLSVSIIIAIFLSPVYQSSATFYLRSPPNLDPLQKDTYYDYKNRVRRALQEQKEIIFSNRVLQKAAEKLYPGPSVANLPKTIEKMRKKLEVTPPTGETFEDSNVYIIGYQDDSAEGAANGAATIADIYQETFAAISREKAHYSYEFFKQQVDRLEQDMATKEAELREYESRKALGLLEILNLEPKKTNLEVGPQALLNQTQQKHHELQEQLAGLKVSIEAMEAEVGKSSIPAIIPEMEGVGRTITVFKNKVAQLQIQLNELKPQFSEQFIPMEQVQNELSLNIHSLREELERALRAQKINAKTLEAKIQEVEKVIAQLQDRIRSAVHEKSAYEGLLLEYNLARDAYTSARNQMEQARLALELNQEKQVITLIDVPVVPFKTSKPNRPLIVLLGFVAGLSLGVASALTLDYFDHSIKRPADISRYLKVPLLGSVSRIG